MDPNQLRSCAYQHAASYPHIALLSLDKLLSKPTEHLLGKGSASISRVISLLRDCVLYGRLVRATTQNSNLVQSSNFQRIFGLSQPDPSSLNEALDGIVVRRHSFVYSRDLARKVGIRTEEGAIFPAAIVAQHVQKGLILKHTLLLEELAKTLDGRKYQSPFNICLYQVRQGRCSLKTCDKYHPAAEDLSIQGFNRRVELHLLVIAALEGLTGVTRRRVQRYVAVRRVAKLLDSNITVRSIWLQRLFGACYPPENRLGGLSWLRTSLIPEYDSVSFLPMTERTFISRPFFPFSALFFIQAPFRRKNLVRRSLPNDGPRPDLFLGKRDWMRSIRIHFGLSECDKIYS